MRLAVVAEERGHEDPVMPKCEGGVACHALGCCSSWFGRPGPNDQQLHGCDVAALVHASIK